VLIEARPGLRLEVAGRALTGRGGGTGVRRVRRSIRLLVGLPAVLLLVVLVVPMIWTLVWALAADTPIVGNFRDILTDGGALAAAGHSVLWVGIALVLIAAGYGIALISRLVRGLWRVLLYILILPFGVAALVSGAVFRIIFDPNPERGMASALFGDTAIWLGPNLIWWVLASSFAWTWLGFIVVLFRAGLDAHPGERPRPGPVTTIVVLTVLVAAIRVFDLILIAAPSSMQDDVDVVGLHWWRMTSRSPEVGGPAALAVILFLIVGGLSLLGVRTLRGPDTTQPVVAQPKPEPAPPSTEPAPPKPRPAAAPPHRVLSWLIGIVVGGFWLLPVVILLATALHNPEAAGSAGWWNPDGLGLGSFAVVSEAWLWPSLLSNLLVAGLATALVVAAAMPAAYLLAWGGLPRALSRFLTAALVVLAVAPVQMYAGPLGDAFSFLGLAGSRAPLAITHAAAGLPFAILVLRTAFLAARSASAAERPAFDAMWRRGRYRPAVIAVVVLEFVLVWNDFIVGFLISGPGPAPLTLLLWGEARQFGTSAGTVAAASVAASVIPVVVLLTTWRKVISGLTGGVAR
jgi:alpha-glucoside transport system permease protein